MIWRILLLSLMLGPAALETQEAKFPSDLERLVSRAQEFRDLMAGGRMVQALEYILPEKRDEVLASGRGAFTRARVVGVDFGPDPDRVGLRIAVELPLMEVGPPRSDFVTTDAWVRVEGVWYFDAEGFSSLWEKAAAPEEPDVEALRSEFEAEFEILEDLIDVGTLLEGEFKKVSVPIRFSGADPLRIETSLATRLVDLDAATTRYVRPNAKSFFLLVNTQDWEGPFQLPLLLTIHYKGVSYARSIHVRGSVFAPLVLGEMTPAPREGYRFSLRNNTEEAVRIAYINAEGKIEIVDHSSAIEANAEGFVHLKRKPGVEPPEEITVELTTPIRGRKTFQFRLRLDPRP